MVVLIVIMGMTAIWMTASLPAWKHNATREKEAELVFRGQQYVRALNLYQRRMGPGAAPLNFDQLYDAKLLRKKYKDPITNDDFLPLYAGGTQPGQGQQPGQPGQQGQPQGPGQGGVLIGVQSKSTATSIMVYNGATHYNEWQFIRQQQQPGGPGGGPGRPGGPGQNPRGGGPGGGPPTSLGGGPGRGPGGPGRGPGGPGRGPGAPTSGPGRGRGL